MVNQIFFASDVPGQQICHEHVGKRVLPVKHFHHRLLIDSHHGAIGHCGRRAQAERLPGKATFSEEIALVQNGYCGSEIHRMVEEAVEKLPDAYRTIFMLRDVEELSTTDAADVLEITEENVKVRLHRARALLRKSLYARAGMERKEAFTFRSHELPSLYGSLWVTF